MASAAILFAGAANAACNTASAVVTRQATVSPPPHTTLDMRGFTAETVIVNNANDVCVWGVRVVGPEPRTAPWHSAGGHDGIQFPHAIGPVYALRTNVINVTDAFSPPKSADSDRREHMYVLSSRASYIRDDFIEDDAALGATIDDVLADGVHTFYSARPGSGETVIFPAATTKISRSLVYLQCMTDNRTGFGCAKSNWSVHWIWKLSPNAKNLHFDVSDTIFMVEAPGDSGPKGMVWPTNATYRNVTLIWIGPGAYPGPTPPAGVRVTKDRSIWDAAKANWLSHHR